VSRIHYAALIAELKKDMVLHRKLLDEMDAKVDRVAQLLSAENE
jgi:hypothetical protein